MPRGRVSQAHQLVAPRGDTFLRAGERVTLLAPSTPSETDPLQLIVSGKG